MDPDRAAVRQQLHLPAQGIHQLHRALQGKAGHIHHHIRLERRDRLSKDGIFFGCLAIDHHPLHITPGRMRLVGFTLPTRNHAHFVPTDHQAGHEIGSDMSCTTYDDDMHLSPRNSYTTCLPVSIPWRLVYHMDTARAAVLKECAKCAHPSGGAN